MGSRGIAGVGRFVLPLVLALVCVPTLATGVPAADASSKVGVTVPASLAFTLPARRTCGTHATLTVQVRAVRHVHWVRAVIRVDGRTVKTLRGSRVTKPAKLRSLPASRFRLSIVAQARHRRHARIQKSYKACAATVPTLVVPANTHAPAVSGTLALGQTLACSPGTWTGTAPISYAYAWLRDGALISGAGGTSYKIVADDQGHSVVCRVTATNSKGSGQASSAAQAIPPAAPPPPPVAAPGRYSGVAMSGGGSYNMSFYVSADGQSLQDVQLPGIVLACAPGGSFADHIDISQIALNADGSFSSTTTQTGTISHTTAHFTYTFNGQVSEINKLAGQLREDITYDNGTAFTCTTNTLPWSVTRDTQGTQAPSPPPGSYDAGTVTSGGTNLFSFYVSGDGTKLQNVQLGGIAMGCAPGGNLTDRLQIDQIPINADGSFASHTAQDGIVAHTPAHYSYTFTGHVHGADSAGAARIAGILRIDLTYSGGSISCTTNNISWSAKVAAQGSQAPPLSFASGPYNANTTNGFGTNLFTFSVSSDHTQIQNVSLTGIAVDCSPQTSVSGQTLTIASVPINADGSFDSVTHGSGVVNAHTATFTYSFRGQFHGPSSAGKSRVAGILRLDLTYDNGGTINCTTNDVAWAATSN